MRKKSMLRNAGSVDLCLKIKSKLFVLKRNAKGSPGNLVQNSCNVGILAGAMAERLSIRHACMRTV